MSRKILTVVTQSLLVIVVGFTVFYLLSDRNITFTDLPRVDLLNWLKLDYAELIEQKDKLKQDVKSEDSMVTNADNSPVIYETTDSAIITESSATGVPIETTDAADQNKI